MTQPDSPPHSPGNTSPRAAARSTVDALFRFKYRAFATFLFVIVATTLYLLFAPRTYESSAKLLMRIGRESITLDPTATIGQTILVQKSHESEINTALEILGSRSTMEKVLDRLAASRSDQEHPQASALRTSLTSRAAGFSSWLDSLAGEVSVKSDTDASTPAARERGVRRLLRRVTVSAPKESMVISIQARDDSPAAAQRIVTAVTDVFMAEHARLNQTSGSYQFFLEQADELERQLNETQRELADRKKEFGFVTVEGKQKMLEDRMRDVSLSELQTQRQVEYTRSKVAQLELGLATVPKELVTQKQNVANAARDAMRSQLYALEIEKSQLPYTADHPLAKAVADRQRAAASVLAEELAERTESQVGVNPTYQMLDAELQRLRSDLKALESQRSELTRQASTMEVDLAALNDQQLEIQELERQFARLASSYETHVASREQARIDAELRSQHISNVNIIQPASFVPKEISPKKAMTLLAGLIAALGGALGMALGSELVDPSMKSAEQLRQTLPLPVLLEVPRDRRRRHLLHRAAVGK